MRARSFFPIASLALLCAACSGPQSTVTSDDDALTIRRAADLDWQALNPARGDASPRAADVWGERNNPGPAGFLVQFVDGFSSPPHVHNVTYRGVVLDGRVHNDDPEAAAMWMPVGSFWTQPAAEAHITAAVGPRNIAYIEIDDGPYLVHPTSNEPPTELPINVHANNRVWEAVVPGWEQALLWGAPTDGRSGRFLRASGDAPLGLRADGRTRLVLVEGTLAFGDVALESGDAALVDGGAVMSCTVAPCTVYAHADAPLALR